MELGVVGWAYLEVCHWMGQVVVEVEERSERTVCQ